jgi:secondary thiamine-phosphate synthase enzyme
MVVTTQFYLPEYDRGFHLITSKVLSRIEKLPKAGVLHLFIQHTSAGLTINENADPSVRVDFENFINKLVPENHPLYTHIFEGADDMPAHLKASIIGNSVSIPIVNHRLQLGTWQGIYLCEFRNFGGKRSLIASVIS